MTISAAIPAKISGLITGFCLLLINLCLLFSGYIQFSAQYSAIYLLACSTAIFLTFLKAEVMLAFFLFCLPVFGNKPGTMQDSFLLIFTSCCLLGLSIKNIRPKNIWPDKQNMLYIKVISPYLLISALSLVPVSLTAFQNWFVSSQTSINDFRLLFFNISSIIFCAEDHPAYPGKSVLLTLLAALIGFFICRYAASSASARIKFACSIFCGLIVSLVVGLLDFYEIISLRFIRGLDPIVNPEKYAYRLQSWFGHSGWYAEYLTITAPFVMILLCSRQTYIFRVIQIIACLLLAEFVLILTFQRGGWLSYPFTLLAIWAAIYVIYRREKNQFDALKALKASILKILICAPLTVIASLAVLNVIGSSFSLDQYTSRFKDITKASDRTDFMLAAYKLGALNPLFGQGSESFALQYKREFLQQDGNFYQQINLPLHGTAHSLYAQTFMGKGLFGIISMCLLIFAAISKGIRISLSKSNLSSSDRIIALACSCSFAAIAIYGFVQELFYINNLQVIFFSLLGLLYSIKTENNKIKRAQIFYSVIIAGFIIHLLLFSNNNRNYSDDYGCYPAESDANGSVINSSWRWCGIRSEIFVPKEQLYNLHLQTADSGKESNHLQIISCNQTIYNQSLKAGHNYSLDLGKYANLDCSDAPAGYLRLKVSSANYFVPAIKDPVSKDKRVLSYRWIMDKDWSGTL